MITQALWEPDDEDLTWALTCIHYAKDGGIIRFEDAEWDLTVHHSTRELHLTRGAVNDRLFDRTVKCFAAVGYKVLDCRPSLAEDAE